MPTRRRLTVLHAPGGFGKTTLLAACRRLRGDGEPVACRSSRHRPGRGGPAPHMAWRDMAGESGGGEAARPFLRRTGH